MNMEIISAQEAAALPKTVVSLLQKEGKTITTAESCTGGLVAKKITDIPGASSCFPGGFVTYSNERKETLLGVSHQTLLDHGAVSRETALEMSLGARLRGGTSLGVGITGIAGPDGGTAEKPVGLVYISLSAEDGHWVYRLQLKGDRETVRENTALSVLDMVRRYLLGCLDRGDSTEGSNKTLA